MLDELETKVLELTRLLDDRKKKEKQIQLLENYLKNNSVVISLTDGSTHISDLNDNEKKIILNKKIDSLRVIIVEIDKLIKICAEKFTSKN